MKAILCQQFGTADDLVLGDIPEPHAGPGEVVARVAAKAWQCWAHRAGWG